MTMMPASDISDMVLNSMSFPVLVVNSQNHLVEINTAAEEFFQTGRKILMRQNIGNLFPSSSPVLDMIAKTRLSSASVSDQGIEIASPILGNRLINLHLSPLIERSGHVVLLIQERSLAERLRGQEQFRGSSRRMSSFASLLAHEIKTPLAGIRGAAELLEGSEDAKGRERLTHLIIAEADRVTHLINRMESLAVGNAISRQPLNIHEIVDHCLDVASQSFGDGYEFEKIFDPSLPNTYGDRDLLIQALINLIKNACEASDIKDKIIIKTIYNLGSKLKISDQENSQMSMLGVIVINRGSGIPETIKSRFFDPFVTSKPDGTGLGLSLVAGIIADHGGSVDVSDQDGETAFQINLPITRAIS